jgi:hypothetical protein
MSNTNRFLGGAGLRDMLGRLRRYLGGRHSLWLAAGLAVAAGLALNWSWLVAVGVAPFIVSILPCAAMCALGLCAFKGADSASPPDRPPRADSDVDQNT